MPAVGPSGCSRSGSLRSRTVGLVLSVRVTRRATISRPSTPAGNTRRLEADKPKVAGHPAAVAPCRHPCTTPRRAARNWRSPYLRNHTRARSLPRPGAPGRSPARAVAHVIGIRLDGHAQDRGGHAMQRAAAGQELDVVSSTRPPVKVCRCVFGIVEVLQPLSPLPSTIPDPSPVGQISPVFSKHPAPTSALPSAQASNHGHSSIRADVAAPSAKAQSAPGRAPRLPRPEASVNCHSDDLRRTRCGGSLTNSGRGKCR
jgi:hypothetical protein